MSSRLPDTMHTLRLLQEIRVFTRQEIGTGRDECACKKGRIVVSGHVYLICNRYNHYSLRDTLPFDP